MAIVFDAATKRIVLDSASVTATELYSRSADWLATSDNAKYGAVFRQVGGDDLGGGLSIPPYYFLQNGWRVRPMEMNQTLVIDGNLFVDGGGDPIVPTLGVFQVLVKSVVPVQAQGISTAGGGSSGGITTEQYNALMLAINSRSSLTLTDVKSAASTGSTVVVEVLTADVTTNMPLSGA